MIKYIKKISMQGMGVNFIRQKSYNYKTKSPGVKYWTGLSNKKIFPYWESKNYTASKKFNL